MLFSSLIKFIKIEIIQQTFYSEYEFQLKLDFFIMSRTKPIEEKMKTKIQRTFFPTPTIPPNLVSRVFGPTCNSEIVVRTYFSKATANPKFPFRSLKPILSTLYLNMSFQLIELDIVKICLPCFFTGNGTVF